MEFSFRKDESVRSGVLRIAREELESAARQLRSPREEGSSESVHEARKRKTRSCLGITMLIRVRPQKYRFARQYESSLYARACIARNAAILRMGARGRS